MRLPPVVVISGPVGAGKTTLGGILRERGFQYARISDAIGRRWGDSLVERPSRDWFREMGMKLHREVGQTVLCQETLALIGDADRALVVDGARWREDIAFFRNRFGQRMVHVHLAAPVAIRRARFERREAGSDFDLAEADEVESEVGALRELADVIVENPTDDAANLHELADGLIRGEGRA